MVARAQTTKISYLFNHKIGSAKDTWKGFIRGNVAVLPQDTMRIRDIIPPSRNEIHEALCALFVSLGGCATKLNIECLGPVLVNKGVIRTLATFLVEHNAWYRGQVVVDEGNINDLCDGSSERAIPRAIEIACLNSEVPLTEDAMYRPPYVDEFHIDSLNDSLVIEAVGYTAGDHTPCNFQQMKATTLTHCLDGRCFVRVLNGSTLVNKHDPVFMSWAFLHLDPFGIGGFNDLNCSEGYQLTFSHQLWNLLLQDDSRFASDPCFAYVCWNVLECKELNRSLCFRISRADRVVLGQTLQEITPALTDLMKIWQSEPWGKSKTDLQRRALSVLNRLQSVSRHVKGTTGYKQLRQNELRGLIREFGTPALFVTVNPADLYNPLFGIYRGINLRTWQNMSLHDRAAFIASHPHVAARAFNEVISAFLDVVVCPKHGRSGFFGECVAYFGMVESQGRGTLHVHFLFWINGNPNPQALRDWMHKDNSFHDKMIGWLEDTIQCELPGQTQVVTESHLVWPVLGEGDLDPQMLDVPLIDSMSQCDFKNEYHWITRNLVNTCNWHDHTETCWKHLHPGDPCNDAHCRMCIDGSV